MIRQDYKSELSKQLAFTLTVQNKLSEIFNILRPNSRARDLGIPELLDSPLTEDMATKYTQFKNAATLKECKKNGLAVFSFLSQYFKVTYELITEISVRADVEVDRIENHIEKPIVSLRDYSVFPLGAMIIYTLATRFNGEAHIADFQAAFRPYETEIIDIINTVINKWKGLIEFDPSTQAITLNDADYRDILALVSHEPIDHDRKIGKLVERYNTEMASLYYLLQDIVPTKFSKFANKKLQSFINRQLSTFSTLFSKKQINELADKQIYTALDFLEKDIYFFKYNTSLTKSEIIECKIQLASAMKYDCSSFEIDVIHPSILRESSPKEIPKAIKDLKRFFNNDELTFADVLNEEEIILTHDDSGYRRICYRIIAFVRHFSKWCLSNNFSSFEPYGRNWNYVQELTLNESNALKIKKAEILKYVNGKTNTENQNTVLMDENVPETESGSQPLVDEPYENDVNNSSKELLEDDNNEN